MSNILKNLLKFFLTMVFLISQVMWGQETGLNGDRIKLIDNHSLNLQERAAKAETEFRAMSSGEYYITGYQFASRGKNITSGTHICSSGGGESKVVRDGDRLRLYHFSDTDGDRVEFTKERTVLFLNRIKGNRAEITDAVVLKGGVEYKTGDIPVFMLGKPDNDESFGYVLKIYQHKDEQTRKRILPLIAVHNHKDASPTLYKTAMGEYGTDLRKSAIFWLSAVKADDSYEYLKKISGNARESKIKKSLVFAFYILDSAEGNRELIRIARSDDPESARKDAIFWLGQRASNENIATLKDVIVNDKDEDVRNAAVFAISQLDDNRSVPLLIDIVNTNRNPNVRKKAMFWLGQKDDKRVIQLFEKILLK
jgi:HEAT repeat protein